MIDEGWELSVIRILARKIEEPVLSDREKQIIAAIQNGAQERIESAQKVFSQDNTAICPYYFQPITDHYKHDLVESINKVLNKDVDNHKTEIAAIIFPELTVDLTSVESLDAALVKEASHQLDICKALLGKYQDYASKKARNIYTPIQIEPNGLSQEIKNLNVILSTLEAKRVEFNDVAKKKAALVRQLISINKAIAHIQITQLYKDFSKQEKDKASTFQKLSTQQKTLEEESRRRLKKKKEN